MIAARSPQILEALAMRYFWAAINIVINQLRDWKSIFVIIWTMAMT
jgi:hypothetical protein